MRSLGQSADWSKWGNMISSKLWQAVALSLDFEPDSIVEFHRTFGELNTKHSPSEFIQRLEIAQNHLAARKMDSLIIKFGKPNFSEVELAGFSSWATEMGWKLPEKFPKATNNNVDKANTIPDYLPPYLAFMIRATRELELTEENIPVKKVIEHWLKENWPTELGQPTQNLVGSLATALRPPEAQKGGNRPS